MRIWGSGDGGMERRGGLVAVDGWIEDEEVVVRGVVRGVVGFLGVLRGRLGAWDQAGL